MEIKLQEITVKDVTNGYKNSDEEGVVAFGGLLNVRPKYQREFVYKEKQRNAVMDTIFKGYPLNVMYWVKVGNNQYEVLDGQQRTLSVMQYLKHKFPITLDNKKYYLVGGIENIEGIKLYEYSEILKGYSMLVD